MFRINHHTTTPSGALWRILATLTFILFTAPVMSAERTMIVLDGSGSMWGQIEGVPKLTIARDTLRDVLPQVPSDTELGLLTYGHREKGNCQDIEMIVPPAPGTAGAISEAADNLSFIGMTPLTDAVRIAAEEMRFTEETSTVILITDGIETCEADPCALGADLESRGVGFTAHVVGFGLSEEEGQQVACLAENTGGQYFEAGDAESLVSALTETVVAPSPEVTLFAEDQEGTEVAQSGLAWSILAADGSVLGESTGARISSALKPGDYSATVSGEGISGGAEFTIAEGGGDRTIAVPVEVERLEATVSAPTTIPAGAQFDVEWTGPDQRNDYVTIVETGADEGTYTNYEYTRRGTPLTVTAPDALGSYEVRYVHGETDATLARQPVELTEVKAALKAPDSVGAGAGFEVTWTGPDNQNDYITIVEQGAGEGEYLDYEYTRRGSPVEVTAPDAIGSYEVRYVVGQSDRTLASVPIEVTAVSAALEAPDTVGAGAGFEVTWTGPDNQNDYITIVEQGAGEGEYLDYEYTRRGSPVEVTAPDAIGSYEVRYVVGQSDRTLASVPIEVTAVSAALKVLNSPVPGGPVEVDWTGPDNQNDYITIVEQGAEEGAYTDYEYTRRGSPVTIDAPRSLGAFEVRYVVGQSDRTLASTSVTLAAATATVAAPDTVAAGGVVEVEWTGPGNREDFIEIVPAGAAADVDALSEARTSQGSPLQLFAPGSAGTYEVRYRMRDTGEVLASAPLAIK